MKRVITYLLTALLLLNVLGYYGLFLGLKYQHTISLTHRLDENNYKEAETFTLKVPLSVPYSSNTAYERMDGEFEHQGEFFRLVKQKLLNDTLYIVCIKDIRSKHIKQALAEYVKTFGDHPIQSKSTDTVPLFIKDYLVPVSPVGLSLPAIDFSFSFPIPANEDLTHLLSLSVTSPPPEA
jgi:hypothetical protein